LGKEQKPIDTVFFNILHYVLLGL